MNPRYNNSPTYSPPIIPISDPIPGIGIKVPSAPPIAAPAVLNRVAFQGSPFNTENTPVNIAPKTGILPKVFLNALLRSFTLFFPRNFKAPRPKDLLKPFDNTFPAGADVGLKPDVVGGFLNADGLFLATLFTLLSASDSDNPCLSAS